MRFASIIPCLAASLLFAGCEVGPNYHRPAEKVEAKFSEPASAVTTNSASAAWWQTFNDPELNHLVALALAGNYDLQMASLRISQSRYQRNMAVADLFPQVNTDGGYLKARGSKNVVLPLGGGASSGGSASGGSGNSGSADRTSARSKSQATEIASQGASSPPLTAFGQGGLPGATTDIYQAGFDASWEIDVFGGKRRSVEAAAATMTGAVENKRDVLVSMMAEVARSYLELRGGQLRLGIARTNLETQTATVDVIRSKQKFGLATELDVARAAAQRDTTAAAIPPLESGVRRMIHALSILVGKEPNELSAELAPVAPLPVTPPEVPVGIPSQLLDRRPDIRASERQLAAASARIGVAVADLYPKFAVTGQAGLDSTSPSTLFNWESRYFLISPTVSWRIFDAGRIASNVKLQKAMKDESALRYRETILKALQEVEDALAVYTSDLNRRRSLVDAAGNARLAVDLAQKDFDQGLIDFLNVLQAQQNALTAEDALAQSSQSICTDIVALYKALGGGWDGAGQAKN